MTSLRYPLNEKKSSELEKCLEVFFFLVGLVSTSISIDRWHVSQPAKYNSSDANWIFRIWCLHLDI